MGQNHYYKYKEKGPEFLYPGEPYKKPGKQERDGDSKENRIGQAPMIFDHEFCSQEYSQDAIHIRED